MRWRDDLTRQLGPVWSRLAQDRYLWDQSRDSDGCSARSEFSPNDDDDDDDDDDYQLSGCDVCAEAHVLEAVNNLVHKTNL